MLFRSVIVDTLAKVRPQQLHNENIYDRDYRSVQGLKKIADAYHVAILIVHHTRKAEADDPLETISGSFGLSGGVDGVLVLKRERGKADAVLHVTGRDVEENEFALKFTFPCWELMGDAEQFRLSEERQAILAILHVAEKATTPKEITQAFCAKYPKANYDSVAKLLSKMAKTGEIKCVGYGKYEISQQKLTL